MTQWEAGGKYGGRLQRVRPNRSARLTIYGSSRAWCYICARRYRPPDHTWEEHLELMASGDERHE